MAISQKFLGEAREIIEEVPSISRLTASHLTSWVDAHGKGLESSYERSCLVQARKLAQQTARLVALLEALCTSEQEEQGS